MKEIAKFINDVGAARGSIEKMQLLEKYKSVEGFKEILQFIYNPYIRTGIAETKLYKKSHNYSSGIKYDDAIRHFNKYRTGSDDDISFAWDFINSQQSPEAKYLATAIATKDLSIGVTATTLNKVYGSNFIPTFGIMLGKAYQEHKHKVKPPYIVTEKLDGHRRGLIKENGDITFYTRTGIVDEGLIELELEAAYLPDNCFYDGEALAIGEFKNALELRQATNSIMNRNGIRTGVTYNVFDSMPLSEFKAGKSLHTAAVRKIFNGAIFKDKSISKLNCLGYDTDMIAALINCDFKFDLIRSVPILGVANNEEEVLGFSQEIWDRHFEGVMALKHDSYYETKRSNNLLKVKSTESFDLKIVDTLEGTGKYEGMLGSLVVDYKGFRVGVGTGLSDNDRMDYWDNRNTMIGLIIEVDTFGETKNKDGSISLNCPVFKGIRYDKTTN